MFKQNPIRKLIATITALAVCVSIIGCTTAEEQQAIALAEQIAPIVASYAATGHVSIAQSLPVFFNSIAIFDPSASVTLSQFETRFEAAYAAWTGDTATGTGSTVQKYIATIEAALGANPTGAQVNAALTNAGIGAADGANP